MMFLFLLLILGILELEKSQEEWKFTDHLLPMPAMFFPSLSSTTLKKWGTNIKLFNDIFIYNILSATKFINGLIQKEQYQFDVVCMHDWLSSISGLVIKNELKIPVVFHTHSTEWGRSGGQGSEVVTHLENAMAEKADRIVTVSYAARPC
jgi:glycogen synthase